MSSNHHYGSNKGSNFYGNINLDKDAKLKLNTLEWVKETSTSSPTQPVDLYIPIMKKTPTTGVYVAYTPITLNGVVTENQTGYYVLNANTTVPTFTSNFTVVPYEQRTVLTPVTQPHPHITLIPGSGNFVIQRAGTYTITADLVWAASAVGSSHRWMSLRETVNGIQILELASNSSVSIPGNTIYNSLSYTRYFNIGDAFQIMCGQSSGVNQQLLGEATFPSNPTDLRITSQHSYQSF